ncbi:hypothetical protein DL546_002936 [Coniochaeta pulveracea]|uniref:Uncharacterized protein n=1 Tax=Coniochaeta pulveracea TaxID=177199 RepID=A0A420Y1G4_9PEZI|nr:hypothetical protein DL546_002936 [Coniochaeta pulveracea]
MLLPPVVMTLSGALALVATVAAVAMDIVLGYSLRDRDQSVKVTAILSSVLEGLVLVMLGWLTASNLGETRPGCSRWLTFNNFWFAASISLCLIAAAASVAALVRLSYASRTLPRHILGSTTTGFLIGSAIALGLSFAFQLVYLISRFVSVRLHKLSDNKQTLGDAEFRRSPQPHVKGIPYHETLAVLSKRVSLSMSPPGSSGGRSATETMSSIRSSLSHAVRPITSRSRLLPRSQRSSVRSSMRPGSIDSTGWHERPSIAEDSFDTWDTSSVDTHTRQTVLANTSPVPGRFLETIPASPAVSRSPSPGSPLDLPLPGITRSRSRSFSPAGSVRSVHSQALSVTPSVATVTEAHIHPLFRSDSPTPPPIATPGTVVTAAPLAGQILPDRKILHRMRSGSFPVVSSPLSRQGSFDNFHQKDVRGSVSPSISPDLAEEPEEEQNTVVQNTERKMTPPIPEWVLSAGSRLSLSGRKLKVVDGGASVENQS